MQNRVGPAQHAVASTTTYHCHQCTDQRRIVLVQANLSQSMLHNHWIIPICVAIS